MSDSIIMSYYYHNILLTNLTVKSGGGGGGARFQTDVLCLWKLSYNNFSIRSAAENSPQ